MFSSINEDMDNDKEGAIFDLIVIAEDAVNEVRSVVSASLIEEVRKFEDMFKRGQTTIVFGGTNKWPKKSNKGKERVRPAFKNSLKMHIYILDDFSDIKAAVHFMDLGKISQGEVILYDCVEKKVVARSEKVLDRYDFVEFIKEPSKVREKELGGWLWENK